MPVFKLVNEDGVWLEDARLGAADWKPGGRIAQGRELARGRRGASRRGDAGARCPFGTWLEERLIWRARCQGSRPHRPVLLPGAVTALVGVGRCDDGRCCQSDDAGVGYPIALVSSPACAL